jgi:hypothetical protein
VLSWKHPSKHTEDFIASDALHSRRRRRTNEQASPSRPQMSVKAHSTPTPSESNDDNIDGNPSSGQVCHLRGRGSSHAAHPRL